MANTIIRCNLPTTLALYRERFGKRVLDSSDKMILVSNVTESEKTELSKDQNIKTFDETFIELPDQPPKVEKSPD